MPWDAASPRRNSSYAARFAVGFAASSLRTLSASATSSALATLPAMSAWTWKTLVSAASNGSCQRVRGAAPAWICTSSGITRTRLVPSGCFSQRTVPESR